MSQKEQREGDRESLLPHDRIPRDRPWQVVLSLPFQRLFMRPRLRKSLLPPEPGQLQLQWRPPHSLAESAAGSASGLLF